MSRKPNPAALPGKGTVTMTGNKNGGAKFSSAEREEVMDLVADLDRRGYSQPKIALELERRGKGVSQAMVCQYLKKIRARYIESQLDNHATMVVQKMQQYAKIREEAWEAWDWSNGVLTEELKEALKEALADDGLEALPDAVTIALRRSPAGEFLRIIADTYMQERKMLGLDKEVLQKHAHLVGEVTEDVNGWNAFVRSIGAPDLVVGAPVLPAPPAIETTARQMSLGEKELYDSVPDEVEEPPVE